MKLLHLADLHIGKRVCEFPMLEDQAYMMQQVYRVIDEHEINGVLIAGDVYDKGIPSAEAVGLFDDFLVGLVERKQQVFIISGNHDSAERLQFGSRLMDAEGIHIARAFEGTLGSHVIKDGDLEVEIFLLPFIKPAMVRPFYPEAVIESYDDAVRTILNHTGQSADRKNILVAHQFVTGASLSGSEEMSVGGVENISAGLFDHFDYVALGHIHSNQPVGRETVRYGGTLLKYSIAEQLHQKKMTIIEITDDIRLSFVDTAPLRDMRTIRGTYMELAARENYQRTSTEDYLQVILTDEEELPGALDRLRLIYPRIMRLEYDNKRTRESHAIQATEQMNMKSPQELFEELFTLQNNCEMTESQRTIIQKEIDRIWK